MPDERELGPEEIDSGNADLRDWVARTARDHAGAWVALDLATKTLIAAGTSEFVYKRVKDLSDLDAKRPRGSKRIQISQVNSEGVIL